MEYDPLLTMSALNLAVVSLHRITSAKDRLTLDSEYRNIINNLRMGEINAGCRRSIGEILTENVLTRSCAADYFDARCEEELAGLRQDENLRLRREELDEYDDLQRKLLGASWKLKYIEGEFAMYSPYWFWRARSAQDAGSRDEAARCFAKFGEVWRPVLRKDPYRAEALKFRVDGLVREGISGKNAGELAECLAGIRENAELEDWANNIYLGMWRGVLLPPKPEPVRAVREERDVPPGPEPEPKPKNGDAEAQYELGVSYWNRMHWLKSHLFLISICAGVITCGAFFYYMGPSPFGAMLLGMITGWAIGTYAPLLGDSYIASARERFTDAASRGHIGARNALKEYY